jgi:hypothetical protein
MAKNEQIELFHIVVNSRELNLIFNALELLREQRDPLILRSGMYPRTEIEKLEDQLSSWRATALNSFTVQLSPAESSSK